MKHICNTKLCWAAVATWVGLLLVANSSLCMETGESALEVHGEVIQIDPVQKRAVVKIEGDVQIEVGSDLIVHFSEKRTCVVLVDSAAPQRVVVDYSLCPFNSDLKLGNRVESSKFEDEVTRLAQFQQTNRWRFSVAGYFTGANELRFDSVTQTGASQGAGTASIQSDAAMGVTVGIQRMPTKNFGLTANMGYETQRNFNSSFETIEGYSTSSIYAVNKPLFSLGTLDILAGYRWDRVYTLAGLNYSVPFFKSNSLDSSNAKLSGGLGGQILFGVQMLPNWAIELETKRYVLKYSYDAGASHVEYGQGRLGGVALKVKWLH